MHIFMPFIFDNDQKKFGKTFHLKIPMRFRIEFSF